MQPRLTIYSLSCLCLPNAEVIGVVLEVWLASRQTTPGQDSSMLDLMWGKRENVETKTNGDQREKLGPKGLLFIWVVI